MGKKLRFWTGAVVGAALQYFYDPKAGRTRRSLLRQGITDRVLDVRGGNKNDATEGGIDHLRLWRTEPRRTASRIV